ncbi:MAG TPA: dihydroneopterin aldolase [Armatimonadota bacterium]|jgi:FolB domain-containing protein
MGRILINDLLARCVLGVSDEERRERQDVVINIEITTDFGPAAASDQFEEALDYRALKKQVFSFVEASHLYLLEALADQIAEICWEDPRVEEVLVRVEKPSALRFARSVAVEVRKGPR